MPYPNKSRGCTPEEPDEGKLQVQFCEEAHSNLGANTPTEGGLYLHPKGAFSYVYSITSINFINTSSKYCRLLAASATIFL